MTERDSIPGLLDVLRNGPVGVPTPEEIEAERQVIEPWLEERILGVPLERLRYRAQRRRRRAWVAAGSALLAAAGALLLLRIYPWQDDHRRLGSGTESYATLLSGRLSSDTLEILPGSRFGEGSILQSSGEEPAVIRGSTGYVARLAPGGKLALAQAPEEDAQATQLRLIQGEVNLSVPRLPAGATLSVLTDDARVIVRGTQFSVSLLEEAGATRTCVRVSEGSVEVQRSGLPSTLLQPGQESGCETPTTPEPEARASGDTAASASNRRRAQRPPSSTLEKETALFASALAAEQAGDRKRAERVLRELLRSYPQSPVAQEARIALQRVTQPSGE